MANKAVPRKRQAAKDQKIERGAKAGKVKRAKATAATNGATEDNVPANVTRDTVQHHAAKIFAQQAKVKEVAEELKTERSALSGLYKLAKEDGVNIDAIKAVAKMRKRDASEIRTEQRDIKRYLSVLAPNHAKQLDMFVGWGGKVSDPDAEGFAAYKNNEPATNNPYKVGSEDAQTWHDGWKRGETMTVQSMAPGAGPDNLPKPPLN